VTNNKNDRKTRITKIIQNYRPLYTQTVHFPDNAHVTNYEFTITSYNDKKSPRHYNTHTDANTEKKNNN